MEYLFDYLAFAAKAVTIALLLIVPALLLAVLVAGRRRQGIESNLEVRKLNDQLLERQLVLEAALLLPKQFKQRLKQVKKEQKAIDQATARPRLFVCDFNGDVRAQGVASLREEITAILAVAGALDEVAVVLESAGGTVHGYGLAASQLRRVRDRGIRLTIIVDKIAASGGYMMACVANEILAAPFAIIGSIGVVAQLPNFHRLLRKHNIDFEQVTAGKYKRTLTLFGENTDADRAKFQEEIDDAHALFKEFVADQRPQLDLERVATGEYWFGTRALSLGLVDRLSTSDEFICIKAAAVAVFKIKAIAPKTLRERLLSSARSLFGERLPFS